MKDHALNQYPEANNATASFNILLRIGLVEEHDRAIFAEYAEPDEYCFVCCLRAYGYAIWHAPTRTRIFALEWRFCRTTLRFSEDDLLAL